jgi:cysteine desulfurase/selenocysteine lyase
MLNEGGAKPLVYFDNAATTLKPQSVIDRMTRYHSHEVANVHRGAHRLADLGTRNFEGARESVQKFLGAAGSDEIIFTRGTTESANLVARSWLRPRLKSGDRILISEMEHHSNIVPWQIVAKEAGAEIVPFAITDAGLIDMEDLRRKLAPGRVQLVAVTACSNVLGTRTPIPEIVRLAHQNGAAVFVDAAQAVSHFSQNVDSDQTDFLAFSGHKLYGPGGVGVLYARKARHAQMQPFQGGGSMIDRVDWAETTWANSPHKFEAGTPAVADVLGLAAAIDCVNRWGLDKISAAESGLREQVERRLAEMGGITIHGQAPDKAAIVSFSVDGAHPSDVATLLDQQGIAVRAGHLCCQPLMRRLGRTGTVRASLAFYNTKEEVDIFCEALQKARRLL